MLIELLAVFALHQGGTTPAPAAVIVDPEWEVEPEAAAPRGALDMNIVGDEVVASCIAAAEGRLVDCRIEEENPRGFGYGREVLASTRRARLDTTAEDFRIGAQVRFTYRFGGQNAFGVVKRED